MCKALPGHSCQLVLLAVLFSKAVISSIALQFVLLKESGAVPALVFLMDVDNTLIDNDHVKDNLNEHIKVEMGDILAARFWELYEQARRESGVVNIPLALKWLRDQTPLSELDEQTYLHVYSLFDN